MIGRRLADLALWLWRQGRDVPRCLCRVGRLDHPAQGPDADPVQDCHDHVRFCRLQSWPVHLFSLITRAGRFLVIAVLLYFYGAKAREIIERRLGSGSS